MELLKRRPLALICTASVLLMLWSLVMPSVAVKIMICVMCILFVALGVSAIVLACCKKRKILKIMLCIMIFIMISIGLLNGVYGFFTQKLNAVEDMTAGSDCYITGEVVDIGYSVPYHEMFYVKVYEINGNAVDVQMILETSGGSELDLRDKFSLHGMGEAFEDSEKYLISDGIVGKILCEDPQMIRVEGRADKNILSFFDDLNHKLRSSIYKFTDGESSALVSALILGNRNDVGENVIRDFRRCGISHALALSGLHIVVIMSIFEYILRFMRFDKKARCVLLILAGIFYLALTGFPLSAVRAVIMLASVQISYLIMTESDSITALFLSVTLILLILPYSIFDVGLWMSFFATLGIIIISDIISPLGYKIKKKKLSVQLAYKLLANVSVTLAAIFFVCVFSWMIFGEISIIAPISNLVITPLITLIIVLGMVLLFVSPIPFLSMVVGWILNILCAIVLYASEIMSHFRWIVVSLKYDFCKYAVIPMLIALLLFLLLKFKRKWIICIIPGAATVVFCILLGIHNYSTDGVTQITYLRESTSETIVATNNTAATVCDISTGGYRHISRGCGEAFDSNATEIENLVLTHYHNYHVNSVLRVTDKYIVRNLYLPEPKDESDSEIYVTIINSLRDKRLNIVTYRNGYEIDIGENSVINVSEEYYIKRSVHPMFFISIKYNGESSSNEFLYYSSPIFENPNAEYPSYPDHIVIGSHGPRIHNSPDIDIVSESLSETLLLSDGEKMLRDDKIVNELSTIKSRSGIKIIIDRDKYRFVIGK